MLVVTEKLWSAPMPCFNLKISASTEHRLHLHISFRVLSGLKLIQMIISVKRKQSRERKEKSEKKEGKVRKKKRIKKERVKERIIKNYNKKNNIKIKKNNKKWCSAQFLTNSCPAVAAHQANSPQFHCRAWHTVVWDIPFTILGQLSLFCPFTASHKFPTLLLGE